MKIAKIVFEKIRDLRLKNLDEIQKSVIQEYKNRINKLEKYIEEEARKNEEENKERVEEILKSIVIKDDRTLKIFNLADSLNDAIKSSIDSAKTLLNTEVNLKTSINILPLIKNKNK